MEEVDKFSYGVGVKGGIKVLEPDMMLNLKRFH